MYCGERAREAALSHAQQRANYAATEIEVLNAKWNVTNVIPAVQRTRIDLIDAHYVASRAYFSRKNSQRTAEILGRTRGEVNG